MVAQPLDAELTVALRDAPVEPYQAYMPVPARLSGRLNEDTSHRITLRDGALSATAKGRNWIRNIEIREPGAKQAAIRVEHVELVGLDFEWPVRAKVAKTAIGRPRVEIERDAEGAINVRRLFTPIEEARKPTEEARRHARAREDRGGSVRPEAQGTDGHHAARLRRVPHRERHRALPRSHDETRLLPGFVPARGELEELRQPARPESHAGHAECGRG